MIASVASIAPCSLLLTGASSVLISRFAASAAIRRVTAGEMVLMSIRTLPGRAPASTPSGPSTTDWTSGESGSMVTTTSDAAATSDELPAGRAPATEIMYS